MADLEFYRQHLGLSSVEDICKTLSDTLIETNHTYDFFVNWSKVAQNRDAFKYEVALLKSLRNSTKPADDLRGLLTRYPEVIKVIPILLACRDGIIKLLNSIEPDIRYKTFDFSKASYTGKEIDDVVEFTERTGLLAMLCQMESATDYLLGVEVGLDTNARKNRSGLFLEKMVREVITDLVARHSDVKWMEQKSFKHVESEFGISPPPSLRDRKFDHVVISKGRATNIEVNFYGGTGSKPGEIVSSYTNRGEVLSSAGWKFIWLTDGEGWKAMQNPLRVGVEYIDYVINAYLLRKGLLEKIILG
jgi:type II restriction enzyme